MSRTLIVATILCIAAASTVTSADAAIYCARFVGGTERMTSGVHAHCDFASLDACRAAVRERGGGHCYRARNMR
jgi:hypothetical protein